MLYYFFRGSHIFFSRKVNSSPKNIILLHRINISHQQRSILSLQIAISFAYNNIPFARFTILRPLNNNDRSFLLYPDQCTMTGIERALFLIKTFNKDNLAFI